MITCKCSTGYRICIIHMDAKARHGGEIVCDKAEACSFDEIAILQRCEHAKMALPESNYTNIEQDGKQITICTIRQKALYTIGLNSDQINGQLYIQHGKKYYKPYRNFFSGKDSDLDKLVRVGYMDYIESEIHGEWHYEYWFNQHGLDWLGEQLGIMIYDEETRYVTDGDYSIE